jgi:CelD/BcsL family acetyltransferase involved in cellulose biosynthesis
VKENRAVAVYTRKGGAAAAPEDPALAKVPEQMRPMVKQALAKIAAENDVEKLRQRLGPMEQRAAGAPAEMKPGIELLVAKTRERIAELEKSGKK